MCPEGQQLHPAESCRCVDDAEVSALYPEWASGQDIQTSIKEGRQTAIDRPKTWRVCPTVGNECPLGGYWNELSCKCFSTIQCMMWCGDDKEMDPTKGCGCMDYEKLRKTFYPSWATDYDIQLSKKEGFEKYEQLRRIEVCPYIDNKDKCEAGFYWNPLACKCFSLSHCKMMCPEGQQLSPTEKCTCVKDSQVDALYPDWASESDK